MKEPWKRQEKVTKKIRFSIFFSWERVLIEKINKGKKKYFRQFIKKPSKKILGRFIFDKSCYKTKIITQPVIGSRIWKTDPNCMRHKTCLVSMRQK